MNESNKHQTTLAIINQMADIPETKTLHINEESSVQISHSVYCPKKDYGAQSRAAQASVNSFAEVTAFYIECTISSIHHSGTFLRHLFVPLMNRISSITLKL